MEKFNITIKDRIVVYFFMTALLFILYLWSGGIYKYNEKYGFQVRVNKITGSLEAYSKHKSNWVNFEDVY